MSRDCISCDIHYPWEQNCNRYCISCESIWWLNKLGIVFPKRNLLCNLFLDKVHIQQCVKLHHFFQSIKCLFLVLKVEGWIWFVRVVKDIEVSEIASFLRFTRDPWKIKFENFLKFHCFFFIIVLKLFEHLVDALWPRLGRWWMVLICHNIVSLVLKCLAKR